MPRSKNRRVAEILDIVKSDRVLLHQFLELLIFALRHEDFLKDQLVDIISEEMGERMARRFLQIHVN